MHRAPGTPGAGRAWGPGSKSRHAVRALPLPPCPRSPGAPEIPSGHAGGSPGPPWHHVARACHGAGVRPGGGRAGALEWAQGSHATVRLPRLTVRFKGRVYRAIAGKKDGVPGTRSEAAAAARGKLGCPLSGGRCPSVFSRDKGREGEGPVLGWAPSPGEGRLLGGEAVAGESRGGRRLGALPRARAPGREPRVRPHQVPADERESVSSNRLAVLFLCVRCRFI